MTVLVEQNSHSTKHTCMKGLYIVVSTNYSGITCCLPLSICYDTKIMF